MLLFIGCIFLCWLFVFRQGVFGSKVDWISQHSVIPDYFRQLFYDSGNLFPAFAPDLGSGQNIYCFSYYGLYNPVILFSYLLPFVKMSRYIMVSSICCYGLSVTLFYRWIRNKCIDTKIAVGISMMFALATPLIYQSYNQIMFVNYMPFLCLALIGTDRYIAKRKKGLLILSVWAMILCSFYFSIGGMLVLLCYATAAYLQVSGDEGYQKALNKQESGNMRMMIRFLMGYIICLLVAVLMAGIL